MLLSLFLSQLIFLDFSDTYFLYDQIHNIHFKHLNYLLLFHIFYNLAFYSLSLPYQFLRFYVKIIVFIEFGGHITDLVDSGHPIVRELHRLDVLVPFVNKSNYHVFLVSGLSLLCIKFLRRGLYY